MKKIKILFSFYNCETNEILHGETNIEGKNFWVIADDIQKEIALLKPQFLEANNKGDIDKWKINGFKDAIEWEKRMERVKHG